MFAYVSGRGRRGGGKARARVPHAARPGAWHRRCKKADVHLGIVISADFGGYNRSTCSWIPIYSGTPNFTLQWTPHHRL